MLLDVDTIVSILDNIKCLAIVIILLSITINTLTNALPINEVLLDTIFIVLKRALRTEVIELLTYVIVFEIALDVVTVVVHILTKATR